MSCYAHNCCRKKYFTFAFLNFSLTRNKLKMIVLNFDIILSQQILKILNSNTENPYLIWDNATRAELTEFLTDQQQQKIRTVSIEKQPSLLSADSV